MVTSVLNLVKRHFGKALVASTLFASSFASAQNGNPITGYQYLGSCTVNGTLHYYYLSNDPLNWNAAKVAAAGLGGYLATLTSPAENNCVTMAMVSKVGNVTYDITNNATTYMSYDDDRNAWIGYTDEVTEGVWQWDNGENCAATSSFTNWDGGEPNNFPNSEDYAQLLMFAGNKVGKWNDWFNYETQRYIVEFGANTCATEGCTPGYWKNHTAAWGSTGYTSGQTAGSVFSGLSAFGSLASKSLLQSLDGGGGPGTLGGATVLIRAATAALLNASQPNVDYPLLEEYIIFLVNDALASNDRAEMLALAATLDGYNNLGCPINAHEGTRGGARVINPGGEAVTEEKAFAVSGYPNPARGAFNVQINGLSTEKVSVRVTDATGRLVEQRVNLAANQVLSVGNTYKPGLYYVEVAQGAKKQQIKMIKQ